MSWDTINENAIADINHYNSAMARSLIDKIFFMDKIGDDITAIVDYGCADGTLINFLSSLFPDIIFIGYDINTTMIEKAKEKNASHENVMFFSKLDDFHSWAASSKFAKHMALNLSSLIHEVYSYGTKESIEDFWYFVNYSHFDYIIIRDMALDSSAHRPSWKEDVLKVRSQLGKEMVADFETFHGSITDNHNLIHLLMKYRYTDNWEREVRENYFPISVEDIASNIDFNYELIYYDHYVLPYLAKMVKRDFDITLKDYTHVKFIYKNRSIEEND